MFRKKGSLLLFLLPGLMLLMLFQVIPFFGGIRYSVTDGTKANGFVGFNNFAALWQNRMYLLGLKNTMELSVICAPLLWVLSCAAFVGFVLSLRADFAVHPAPGRAVPLRGPDALSGPLLRHAADLAGGV